MGRWSRPLAVLVVLLLVAVGVLQTGIWVRAVSTGEYETTAVTAVDANGSELATVDARVADTPAKRTVGLSRTGNLAADGGMVFVFDETGRHSFVMRGMSLPLDIIFADANGTVTAIHHASAPDGLGLAAQLEEYRGRGKYVLEVNRGWANRTGVDVGDRIAIPGEVNRTASDGGAVGGGDGADGGTCTATSATPATTATATMAAAHRRPTVTAVDANGSALGTVRVRVADDGSERYTGLSDTESLAADEGMLFVYDREGNRTFVMRQMDFPLDIVFVDSNGTVTTIHHAPVPPEGTSGSELKGYGGHGKYVLEVNRGWANETGLDVGDCVRVPANVTASS